MKTIAVKTRSQELRQLLELAKHEDIVIRTPEGDEFTLSLIDDFDVELALQRRNKKLMAFLDERLAKARQEDCIPLEEVKRQLGLNTDGSKKTRRKARAHSR